MNSDRPSTSVTDVDPSQSWRLRHRTATGFAIVVTLFVALIARLLWISTIAAEGLTERALAQRVAHLPVRGGQTEILDRNLIPLGLTKKSLYAAVSGEQGRDQLASALADLTGYSVNKVKEHLDGPYQGIWQWPNPLSEAQWAALRGQKVTGLMPVLRDQVDHMLATHLVGGPEAGLIGHPANAVSSVPSLQTLAVPHDPDGQPLSGLIRLTTISADALPRDLVTSIDGQIQSMVEQVMCRTMERGAVVVMDPTTGEVLAMASSPGYHPDSIAEIITTSHASAPLINRALSFYPPGSVFKLLVAGAALEEGAIREDDHFFCPGYVDVGDVRIACTGFHGEMVLEQAIMESCNAAFVDIGLRLGYTQWRRYAELLGIGSSRHLPVIEDQGQLDFPYQPPIYDGDLANLSIGQGRLLVTPLDIAILYSTIANGGAYHDPVVVLGRRALNGTVVRQQQSKSEHRLWSYEVNLKLLRALRMTVSSGTGKAADSTLVAIAGKSGTAETGKPGINHAWFAAMAPYEDPEIVVVVFVEDGQRGGQVAGPIAKEIIERIMKE